MASCVLATLIALLSPGTARGEPPPVTDGRSAGDSRTSAEEAASAADVAPADEAAPGEEEPPSILHASLEEGLRAESRDGRFALRVGALITTRGTLSVPTVGGVTPEATLRFARPFLTGHIGRPWITFFLQPELAGPAGPRLLDAEATIAPWDALQLRVGQFRTPVSRAFITPIFALQLGQRSVVSDYFRAGRQTGFTLQGFPFDGKLEYYAGVFNGNGINRGGNDNSRLMYVGRLVYSPLGRFDYDETAALKPGANGVSLGLDGYHNRRARSHTEVDEDTGEIITVADPDLTRSAVGADIAARAGPVWSTAEAFLDWRDAEGGPVYRGFGLYVQAGVMMLPGTVDVTGRFSMLATDLRRSDLSGMRRYSVATSYYFAGNNVKLQLQYDYTDLDSGVLGLPDQLVDGHRVFLQLQLLI